MASRPFSPPRPEPRFRAPRTQQEISAAELDGDPLTGLEVQTALDGDPIDEARLRANFDGDPLTKDPSANSIPTTSQEITTAAMDGDPMTGLAQQNTRTGSPTNQIERRANFDGQAYNGIERRADRLEKSADADMDLSDMPPIPGAEPAPKAKLPSPWDRPGPKPPGY